MDTPICDFVAEYAAAAPLRLHMPGHKGLPLTGPEALDITEIPGADVLSQADGIIRRSQENAAGLFGTAATFYSAEGSSLSIRAMLYLAVLHAARQGKPCRIAAARNAHKVFITASALLDIEVSWLYPEEGSLLSCVVTPEALAQYLDAAAEKPTAVYITSPDYLGFRSDIAALAAVCHGRGVLLLVDNAHGAYLKFLPEDQHPITLGADACCDSAHKTLPVLTGGGYLHISPAAPDCFREEANRAMALFASTSPSYLILQSLDRANRYLAEGYREKLAAALPRWEAVREELRRHGFRLAGNEPLKLTILPKCFGYTGTQLEEALEEKNIFCEFADPDHLVLMLSPEFTREDAAKLLAALTSLPRRAPITEQPPKLPRPERAVSPRRALYLPREVIPLGESVGRIMADPCVSCPPAIPIVAFGERIDADAVQAMEYYGVTQVQVLTEK